MNAHEIIRELRRRGWHIRNGWWASPHHKRQFQSLTLGEAASHECLEADEILPNRSAIAQAEKGEK